MSVMGNHQCSDNKSPQHSSNLVSRYKYHKRGNAGREGSSFQIDLLTLFLLNALKGDSKWQLSTENMEGDIFDDVVFQRELEGDILLQAKHKQDGAKKTVTYKDLLTISKKCDFSLPKYFFSYQEIKSKFRIENIVICTNAQFDTKGLNKLVVNKIPLTEDSILYFGGTNCDTFCYTFNECIKLELKQQIQMYGRQHEKNLAEISDDTISEYLKHLQLVASYPSGELLQKILETIILQIEWAHKLNNEVCLNYIRKKIDVWFCEMRKDKGTYLTQADAKAFFSEIRSKLYCDSLKDTGILFKKEHLPIVRMSEEKRVLHIVPSQSYLLSVVKVWQAIEREKLTETLFLRLDRESNVNKYAVDAFELKRFTHLVIVDDSQLTDGLQQIHDKLFDVLNRYVYKKVILIARTSKILDQIKSTNAEVYKVFTDEINFTQLVEEMQESMRKTKNITFQGEELSLTELCLTPETLGDMLDAQILETLAKRENVRIGHSISTGNNEYHIIRNLWDTEDSQRVSEDTVYDHALAWNKHVILISAEAGMGKSATLTKISLSIKENHPHLWIVRINLNTFTKCLLDCHNNNKRSLTAWELLNSLEGTKLKNNLEKQLFLLQERIVLMIDAVDEVSPKYTDIVLDFLVDCKNRPNFKVIFISTRPHVRKALEDVLQPITFTLAPFSKKDQVEFVSEYWSRTLRLDDDAAKKKCQLYANALISQVEKWINDSSEQFSGVPLQTRMLAEVFMTKSRPSNEDSEEWQGCKEFLVSNIENSTLPKKVNLLELYQIFIDKKQDVFIYEKGNDSGNLLAEEALRRIFEDCQNHHRLLALKVVVEENFLDIFHCFRDGDITKSDHTNLLKIGIVCEIDSDLHFTHRTFAEYFTAQVLMMELTREHQNKRFRQFFLNRVLKYRSFKVIRAFLDELLKQQLDAMSVTALEHYSLDKNQFKQDEWGFSFLHIISEEGRYGILSLFFKRVNSRKNIKNPFRRLGARQTLKSNLDMKELRGETPLHKAADNGCLSSVRLLVEAHANPLIEDNFSCTPLHFAAREGHLNVVRYLMEETDCKPDHRAIHESAVKGHLDVVKYLAETRIDIKSAPYYMALHAAAFNDQLQVMEYLLSCGIDVNIKNDSGLTPLHYAVEGSCENAVRYLMEKGADINRRSDDGETPLSKAARDNITVIVQYLVENGASIELEDDEGSTPLHKATQEGHLNVVRCLIENGANINCRNRNGSTPLHEAAHICMSSPRHGYRKIVELLVENGVDLHVKNEHGDTAADCVADSYALHERECLQNLALQNSYPPGCPVRYKLKMDVEDCKERWKLYEFLIKHGAEVRRQITPKLVVE